MRTAMKAVVRSKVTEEVIKEFTGVELYMGNQWWTAWCIGQYYTIDEIEKTYSTITYWVH